MEPDTANLLENLTLVVALGVAVAALWRSYMQANEARIEQLEDEIEYLRDLNKAVPYISPPQVVYRAPARPPSDDPRQTQPLPPEELLAE